MGTVNIPKGQKIYSPEENQEDKWSEAEKLINLFSPVFAVWNLARYQMKNGSCLPTFCYVKSSLPSFLFPGCSALTKEKRGGITCSQTSPSGITSM